MSGTISAALHPASGVTVFVVAGRMSSGYGRMDVIVAGVYTTFNKAIDAALRLLPLLSSVSEVNLVERNDEDRLVYVPEGLDGGNAPDVWMSVTKQFVD
ncbi:hypothetical protein MMC13_003529 [Lambiella insularis]|nr:hypothetical protein [Lambiella insularis]